MTKKKLLLMFLVFSFTLTLIVSVKAQTQQEYVLQLEGPTWDHSVLTILVVPQYDQSWWNTGYLNSTLRAISQWNDAIPHFAANQSGFSYLSQLRMAPEVSNTTIGGFDVYISWIKQFGNQTCDAGLTQTTYTSTNVVVNSTINFSALDCLGNVLNEVDMQNVALHELGHCWGLEHANFTGDVMYFSYSLGSPVRELSTLDVYGVGTVFRWMAGSGIYDPVNQGTPMYSVTLPPDINYEYMPVSASDTPPQAVTGQISSFLEDFAKVVLQPEVLILVLLAVSAIVAYGAISRMRRRRVKPDQQ
jgi:hypothetical protein